MKYGIRKGQKMGKESMKNVNMTKKGMVEMWVAMASVCSLLCSGV